LYSFEKRVGLHSGVFRKSRDERIGLAHPFPRKLALECESQAKSLIGRLGRRCLPRRRSLRLEVLSAT
jgi:hypothetical protein